MKKTVIAAALIGLLSSIQLEAGIIAFQDVVAAALTSAGQKTADEAFHGKALQDFIATHDNVIVKFYANWCGPCRRMKQAMTNVMKSFQSSVDVVDIDVDLYDIPGYPIRSIPHVFYYKNGVKVGEHHSLDEAQLRTRIQRNFAF